MEQIFKGKDDFIDSRGKISNYNLTEPVNLIGYIESKKKYSESQSFSPNPRTKMFVGERSVYKCL